MYLGCALLFAIHIKQSDHCNSFIWYILVIKRNWILHHDRVRSQIANSILTSKWQHTSVPLKIMHYENGKQHNKKMHSSNISHMGFPAMMKYLDSTFFSIKGRYLKTIMQALSTQIPKPNPIQTTIQIIYDNHLRDMRINHWDHNYLRVKCLCQFFSIWDLKINLHKHLKVNQTEWEN